ncbi:MAG TPA: MMPL family transporter [Acidimicrobiia bacterium]|nr:MMPL family transporter [Acidimicrobiia bacterium]
MTSPASRPEGTDSLLRRVGRFSFRRRWLVIGIWIAALLAAGGLSATVGTGYSNAFSDLDSEADQGFAILTDSFGGSAGGREGQIVFVADAGVDDPANRAAVGEYLEEIAAIGGLEVASPYAPGGERQIATEGDLAGELAFATVSFPPETGFGGSQDLADQVKEAAPEIDGVRFEYGGEVFGDFQPPDAELLGLAFAVIILIAVFGSVLAMGLPIGMALAGIGTGISLVGLISTVMDMPEFTTTLGLMIGLGVGIDYALFIVTRYREDRGRGMPAELATAHAIDTAGRAVLFAGITVMISLLGMIAMGLGFIRGLGIGAAVIVACSVLASLTLLPALIGAVGDRIEVTRWRGIIAAGLVALGFVGLGLKVSVLTFALPLAGIVVVLGLFVPILKRPLASRRPKDRQTTRAYRWSRLIQRAPWPAAIVGFVGLLVLALPVLGLRLGFSDTGNAAEGTTNRQAYDLLARGFGPGFNGPLLLVAEVPADTDPAELVEVTATLNDTPGIAAASPPQPNEDGTAVRWIAIPETSPQDAETTTLVRELRTNVLPDGSDGTVDVLVTGRTALSIDFSDYLASRYPLFFTVVLGLSFMLLMMVFRSLMVPIKAVVMNLLSIGAAYGIIVAIFQWGWAKDLFGIGKGGPIEPFVPMMLFAIVFGLSMDYEVFLLSRIKEEYDRTGNNASAVADGLAATARVITAAAAIMVVVFGSFMLEDDRTIKLFGLGLALAVLLDATVVRMLLVPATMELLGDRNWWIPRWIERILPAIHIEGRPEPAWAGGPHDGDAGAGGGSGSGTDGGGDDPAARPAGAEARAMSTCPNGHAVAKGARFCRECGVLLPVSAEATGAGGASARPST